VCGNACLRHLGGREKKRRVQLSLCPKEEKNVDHSPFGKERSRPRRTWFSSPKEGGRRKSLDDSKKTDPVRPAGRMKKK